MITNNYSFTITITLHFIKFINCEINYLKKQQQMCGTQSSIYPIQFPLQYSERVRLMIINTFICCCLLGAL